MKPNGSALRCALYARVSTLDQSLENQLAQLREFAIASGWDIVYVFTDEASAKSGERPGFKSMMEHASRRQFDVLLFWALDRLTREGLRKTIYYLQRLDDLGVTFRSFTEGYLDTCGIFRDVVIGLMATLAQQERIRISERTRAGLARVHKWHNIGSAKAERSYESIPGNNLASQERYISSLGT
jgi:DNA invertase Pin-like site-specific DNA recombinase